MSVREWSIKPGELRALSRGDLLLFGVRCAMRVEKWKPKGIASIWTEGLRWVVGHALAETAGRRDGKKLALDIGNAGVVACNRLEDRDEPRGRCINYSTDTLSTTISATLSVDRKHVLREVIIAAQLSASIPAVLAHAGRIATRGDVVKTACLRTWAEIKADARELEGQSIALRTSKQPVKALRALAPLWRGDEPSWASPS